MLDVMLVDMSSQRGEPNSYTHDKNFRVEVGDKLFLFLHEKPSKTPTYPQVREGVTRTT